MQTITTIGLDIANRFSRFTPSMPEGRWCSAGVLVEREFWRSFPSCRRAWLASKRVPRRIIGPAKSRVGRQRLMPPAYVKAYVKRGKNDAADAAAICEAVTRPSMRFVPIKNVEQQSVLMLHRTRELLIRQRTEPINALRAHLAELGLVAAKGREGVHQLVTVVTECGGEK